MLAACRNFLTFDDLSLENMAENYWSDGLLWFCLWHVSILLRIVSYIWYDHHRLLFMDEQLAMLQLENSNIKKQKWVPYSAISKSVKTR